MPQVWSVPALGGFSATASLDNELRQRATATTFFHQMSLGLSSYGRHRGDRVLFDKLGRVQIPLNTAGIGETDDIPVTTFPLVQGSVIVNEFANAIEWTEKLEQFSQFPVGQMVAQVLRQDQVEQLDKVAFAAYALGRVVYTPTSATGGTFSTTGSPGATATNPMTTSHVKDITDFMRKNKVPPMAEGKYFAIVHVDHARGIKNSSDFIQIHVYDKQVMIYDSEIGEFAGVRFVEENNVLASPAGTNSAGFAQGVYFGADNVVEAVAVAPHLRYKVPVGYGRDRGEASYAIIGFVQVWSFNTDSGEEHQVRADSN